MESRAWEEGSLVRKDDVEIGDAYCAPPSRRAKLLIEYLCNLELQKELDATRWIARVTSCVTRSVVRLTELYLSRRLRIRVRTLHMRRSPRTFRDSWQ